SRAILSFWNPVMNDVKQAGTATGDADLDEQVPNSFVRLWVAECAELCEPAGVRVLDGTASEKADLIRQAVSEGVLIEINQQKLPGCYLHRSNPNDVARTEHCTFICTPGERLAGPTNNWMPDHEAYARLRGLYTGCMRG